MPVESFQTLIDYATDCSVAELNSTIGMIVTLLKHRKITNGDIELAMTKQVESINSFSCDNPRTFGHVGQMFCDFANVNAPLPQPREVAAQHNFLRPLCVQTRSVANRDHVILVLVHLRHTLSQLK